MDFEYLTEKSDGLLSELVQYIMGKGESEWFETKSDLSNYDIKKIPKLIASISNRGGGIIFYGWSEEKSIFTDINPDYIQRIMNQQSDKCHPKIILKYHVILNGKKRGLFVGIPALKELIKDEEGKYYLRMGSHKDRFTEMDSIKPRHIIEGKEGHLYIENLQSMLLEISKIKYCKDFNYNINYLHSFSGKLLSDITNRWEIDYQIWLSNPSDESIIRVRFNEWKKMYTSGKQGEFSIEIIKWINQLYELLSLLGEKYSIDELKILLKDLTYREGNKTHHRRCLMTLINQENLWNFADARISIWKELDGYLIIQEEANKDITIEIKRVDRLDKEEIETIIQNHNRIECLGIAKKLINRIEIETGKIKVILCN